MSLLKNYQDTQHGQIHAYVQQAREESEQAPLICLHPAPTSGLFFKNAMPMLNDNRLVVAPDYPGYGGSYELDQPPTIQNYADAITESLDEINPQGKIDLLGFHTGCLVAIQMALENTANRIGRVILVDVPYFEQQQRQGMLKDTAKPLALSADVSSLSTVWESNISKKLDIMPLERAFELLVESWRPGQRNHYAFHAAFSYDCESHFANCHHDIDVIATNSGLHTATLSAAKVLASSSLHVYDDISAGVFDKYAEVICPRICRLLDNE